MRFAFTDEQFELRDAVHEMLTQRCDATTLRAAWANESGRAPAAWAALYDMGVLDAMRPAASGGLDMTEVDVVLILETTGRFALPEPIVETMMVSAPLDLINADGESAAVVTSESPFAAWADSAATIVELTASGITATPRSKVKLQHRISVDGARRLFDVELPRTPIVSTEVARAFRRGVLGTAAQLCGLADRMLDLTVEYAQQRKQFGVPIGSFQAIKHHLADARIKLEFARPLVYRAAASLSVNHRDASIHVGMAKAAASDAAMLASRAALQCHGAIGYTTEYDLHLYMKRAWALSAAWGDATWHRQRVSDWLFSPTQPVVREGAQ